jgi:AsmA protein
MKRALKIVAIVIAVIVIIIVIVPFFIDANTFRPKLESELTDALGRPVTVGNLSLSLWSGSVGADNIAIADDPAFSTNPFVQAKSFKVGVEMIPLIFHKTLNITELTLNQPEINLVKSEDGEKWNFSSIGTKNAAASQQSNAPPEPMKTQPESKPSPVEKPAGNANEAPASSNPNLTVAKLNVSDGRVTISQVGSQSGPHVYSNVNVAVKNFAFTNSFPFSVTANLPGGGSLDLTGNAGPINPTDAALTPLNANLAVKNMNLAQSGFIDPAAGIAGIADLSGTLNSDGHEAKVNGTLRAMKLQVAKNGAPAGRDVEVTFATVYNLANENGTITQGDIAMGKAVAHLTGNYDLRPKVTTVDLKLNGQDMPVDELEAMLPAVGVKLPPGATLQNGDLNIDMASTGPVDKLVTTGSIKMENASLGNFDLGSRLSAISALAGKQTGSVTEIKNLSSDVHVAPEGTQANNINLDVPSIGTMTGNGTVSPSDQLAFQMTAAVAGLNVPFAVEGTTSNPKFVPNVKGMAKGLLQNVIGGKGKTGQQNPLNGLKGLFKK